MTPRPSVANPVEDIQYSGSIFVGVRRNDHSMATWRALGGTSTRYLHGRKAGWGWVHRYWRTNWNKLCGARRMGIQLRWCCSLGSRESGSRQQLPRPLGAPSAVRRWLLPCGDSGNREAGTPGTYVGKPNQVPRKRGKRESEHRRESRRGQERPSSLPSPTKILYE